MHNQIPQKAKYATIRQFGTPDVFQVEVMPVPEIKDDQLLIKVYAASVNPIDWKQRKGNHRFILGAPFPIVLGYDVSGTVVKTGKNITQFKPGDEVFGVLNNKYGGAYGQYAKGTEKCFALKPSNVGFNEAAAVPMAAMTALQALRNKADLKPSNTVLINGAGGGVGHIAMQISKLMGARVYAVGSTRSRNFIMQYQPDDFIDYTRTNLFNTNINVDVFFDVAGNYDFFKSHRILNNHGVYINTLPRPKILWHKFYQLFTAGKRVKTLLMKHSATDIALIARWMAEKKLNVAIDKTFKLDNIQEAHLYAQQGHSKGKSLILMP